MKKNIFTLFLLMVVILCDSCHKEQTKSNNSFSANIISIENQISAFLKEKSIVPTSITPSSSSSRLYEAHVDDGLYLFLVDSTQTTLCDFLDNEVIGQLVDLIEDYDSTSIEWQLSGTYKLPNPNNLEVLSTELKRRITWEGEHEKTIDTIYHKSKITHYKLSLKRFELISQDSTIIIDEEK